MDLKTLLTASDGLELLETAKEVYDRVQQEKAREVPLVMTLTGNEIEESPSGVSLLKADPETPYFDLVRVYFKDHIQGKVIKHPFLGDIHVNSADSWGKVKVGVAQKNDKSMAIPSILEILQHGKCSFIETVRPGQKKSFTHVAYLLANLNIQGEVVEYGLSVVFKPEDRRYSYNIVKNPTEHKESRDTGKYEGVTPVAGYDSASDLSGLDSSGSLNLFVRKSAKSKNYLEGRQNKVKTAKGTRLDTNLAVIEAGDLIASHDHLGKPNPDYPQELQPRDRSRQSSQQQIHNIAKELDPDSLGRSNRADSGAPIIGQDLVVESGNGRTIAIKLAYAQGKAEDYREWIIENADYFGVNPEKVAKMKEPVLVRVRKTDVDRAQFAVEANQDDKLSYSATERAKSDAKRITGALLDLFNPDESGNFISSGNMKFIQGFLSSLGEHEAAQYLTTDGKPTQALVQRIKCAVFSKAYNDDRLLEMVADQTKTDLQNMLNALMLAAPKFIEAQAADGATKGQIEDVSTSIVDSIEKSLDRRIVDAILDAAAVIEKAKFNNQAVSEYVDQLGLFGDLPEGVAELAVFMAINNRSAKKLSIAFKAMADFAEKSALDNQNFGLFGDPEPVSIKDAVAYANTVLAQQYGDEKSQINMFDSSTSEVKTQKLSLKHAADQAATSPNNDIPEPSDQDKIDGNYLKGKLQWNGHVISIENPAGSIRSGTDENGNEWSNEITHHYGYFDGTTGADGDELDVFIKKNAARLDGDIYVIDQVNPETGRFDEHKVVLGALDAADAKSIYLSNYEKGWKGFGKITTLTPEEFTDRLLTEFSETSDAYDDAGLGNSQTVEGKKSLDLNGWKIGMDFNSEGQEMTNNPIEKLIVVDALKQPLQALRLALDCMMYKGTEPAFVTVPIVEYTTKKGKLLKGVLLSFDVDGAKDTAKAIDPYTFKYKNGWFIRLKYLNDSKHDDLLTPEQLEFKQGLKNATYSNDGTPGPSGVRQSTDHQTSVAHEPGSTGAMAGTASGSNGPGERTGDSTSSVSDGDASGIGSGRNKRVPGKPKRSIASADFTTNDSQRSNAGDESGPLNDGKRDRKTLQAAQKAGRELSGKALLQQKAEGTETDWGNAENIADALPFLLEEQQDDVLKAENRLIGENHGGILFTNGTGTGKTFTGLGAVKRFDNAGLKNILIVSMNNKIVRDFIKSAKALNLNVHQLEDVNDNGGEAHNIVATTYANLAQNKTLADKNWHLIVVDESHNLMQSEDGKLTAALSKIRALSGHHAGFDTWFDDKYRGERPAYQKIEVPVLDDEGNPVRDSQGKEQTEWIDGQSYAEGPERDAWYGKMADQRQLWKKTWNEQPKGRTKVIFLSATPFSYVKNIDWAEGFLYHFVEPEKRWGDAEKDGGSYNSGNDREQFYMQNFGYTMRYNKLTSPDGKVNAGVNEREFANKLKSSGAMSGRELVVPFDYDRKFILIKSAIGQEIDRGLDILFTEKDGNDRPRYASLLSEVLTRFDYLSRQRLLEAIKADAAVDQIKKSLALGRKVIVFHDYNTGGGFSPFNFESGHFSKDRDGSAGQQYDQFRSEHPELVNLDLDFDSPIETLKAKFPTALLFNGTVSNAERIKNADLFNDDNSGRNVIIVQSDAGSTGISFHDTTGVHQRVIFNLGLPKKPAKLRQTEGRIYRVGQASNAIHRYLTTGTKWETSAFAQVIAQRAETVDNLAKGDDAVVSIRDAIIHAYENAEYFEPSLNDGVGGKAYDEENARIARMTAYDKALNAYYVKGKNRDSRRNKIGVDWYATPEPVGLKMVQWAGVHKGDDVLEPSAGDGAIGRWVSEDANLVMIEPSNELASRAQLANTSATIHNGDFEAHNTMIKYDAIVMNPPFGHAGSLALEHVKKACKHLRDGGRVVALVPNSPNLLKGLEEWQDSAAGKEFYLVAKVGLPASTFENANTSVNTFVMILERHSDAADAPYMRNIDLTSVKNNEELFDAIRDVNFAARKLRDDEALAEYGLSISPYREKYILSGIGVNNAEISKALLDNTYIYRGNSDDTLEVRTKNVAAWIKVLREKNAPKLLPHHYDGFDAWQHDGVYERINLSKVKVDLKKYVRRETKATMKGPIVVQERGNHYVLLVGYERFRLAMESHEAMVPAIVINEQYVVTRETLIKAYKKTANPLDPEVFAQKLLDVLDDEAVALLA